MTCTRLRIPNEVADRASRLAWRAGKVQALRPVFRELGHPAAFVYEALEQANGAPQRSFELTAVTGLSRRAVYEALETLAAWRLVEPIDGRWVIVAGTSLQLLAEQFGCLEQVRVQVGRHRAERQVIGGRCGSSTQHPAAAAVEAVEEVYLWPPEPPPDDRGNPDGPAASRARRVPDRCRVSRWVVTTAGQPLPQPHLGLEAAGGRAGYVDRGHACRC